MAQGEIPDNARGYRGFRGTIGRTLNESRPWWPEPTRPPAGSPNIVVVLADDMGWSDIGPFGSEIPTPALDRIADRGFRLTNYHTTPLSSPARAAALTGLNPHRAGFATVANSDPGFPGVRLELGEDVATLPEILKANGWATFAVGKWHLTRDALIHEGADKSSWPIQRGFEHYYGSLEGLNSFFHPNQLVRDNTAVQREDTPEGYYLTDDYTDRAIEFITAHRASSERPFFLYFAHTAMHGPLGAKRSDIERFRGRYDAGWDELRAARHRRQVELGVVPPETALPPKRGKGGWDIPDWEGLDPARRERFARYQEVYAAMVGSIDESLGRITVVLEELGELDNTIIVFTSDNGASAEGGPEGTRSYFSQFLSGGVPDDWDFDTALDLEEIGGPRSMAHYPEGWGMVSNTPFRSFKGHTYAGGVRVPFLLSWPDGLGVPTQHPEGIDYDAPAGLRTQYQYVTDLVPTLLDLAGVEHPADPKGDGDGDPKRPDGVSFAPNLRDGSLPSRHEEQYVELGGNRGFYRDGWKAIIDHTPGTDPDADSWELYRVADDPTETTDLAAERPEVVADLAKRWEDAAWRNTVFPIVDPANPLSRLRRPDEEELARPVRLLPGTPRLERYRSSKLTALRDFDVEIDVELTADAEGVLVAHGDQGGGYLVAVEGGSLVLVVNEYGRAHRAEVPLGGALAAGRHTVVLESRTRPEFRADWRLRLAGEDPPLAELPGLWAFIGMAPFSGIDVGVNRGGPVDWGIYERHGSFRYGGRLHSVTYRPGQQADYSDAVIAKIAAQAAEIFD
ncbi:arylsulfatase [Corynebacterium otitidis]|uniref:arylsulfatase n=1 Tax=Corynebacterium otitidis TaxID=29321 RepID=UPI000627F61A|nr:arylsulfatase [Corynebacterium otitidis]KKO84308.1 arylsulfatase [Corynebacterium otitidis]